MTLDFSRRRTALALAASSLSLLVAPALAQDGGSEDGSFSERLDSMPEPEASPPIERPRTPEIDTRDPEQLLQQSTINSMVRLAIGEIRNDLEEPSRDDYRRIALMLSYLNRWTPKDAERLRLELNAWTWANDKQREADLVKRLVKLDPQDTVLQMRLVNEALSKKQDAESRLALYDRLLGPAGASLDDSVKSRLALDAALLYRENGDEARYLSALGYSTELDSTNKQAAALYATYFLDRTRDPLERLEVLVNVVIADPHDQEAHLNVAHELMERGAWLGAQRFLARVNELHQARGTTLDQADLFDITLSLWNAEGADDALSLIQGLEDREAMAEIQRRQEMISRGQNPVERPVLLPVNLESIRLAIYTARGETELATESLSKVSNRFQIELNVLRNPEARPPWVTEERALRLEQQILVERIAARLWSGLQLDRAETDMVTLREIDTTREVSPETYQRFEGLFAAQNGELEKAEELLTPLASSDALAHLGLGIVAQRRGESDAAVKHYAHAALMSPNSAIGSAARMTIELLRGQPIALSRSVRELNDYALGLDPWLDRVTNDPYSFMRLTIEHDKTDLRALDPMGLTLTLRNVSRQAIAVGPNSPIQSRIMLAPAVTINSQNITQNVLPEVVHLDRRLRLLPGEAITVPVWAGRGWIGSLNEFATEKAFTARWSALQNFVPNQQGGYTAGPLSVSARSDLMRRSASPIGGTVEDLAEAIRAAEGTELLERVLQSLSLIFFTPQTAPLEERQQMGLAIGNALLDRMATMNEYERAFTLVNVFRARGLFFEPTMKARLVGLVENDDSPLVQLAMLQTFIQLQDEAYFSKLEAHPDPLIAEVATLKRALFVEQTEILNRRNAQRRAPASGN